jgi:hypothetical protein
MILRDAPYRVLWHVFRYGENNHQLMLTPKSSLLLRILIMRTTAFSAGATLTIGAGTETEDLVTAAEAKLDTAVPAGLDAGCEEIVLNRYFEHVTPINMALGGGPTVGQGIVLLEYVKL